ncbi:MAG: hypothetical protein N3D20_00510 [Candidatus Pacearchaeota archaeon]|nr:hypothetical protein [Candidatus Pacearchaeota archaeon]
MRLWIKILLVILFILAILCSIVFITIYQAIQIISIANDKTIQEDISALMQGDCSKLAVVETKWEKIQNEFASGCKNPIIKILIEKKAPGEFKGICTEINNPNNKINKNLAEIRQNCSKNRI